ncbi:hypothetical protein AB4Z48_17805 [Cupriavidus sp. 2TAF22]|uniref:hypothetical protein n=1 Tax=unclassified Cupriavidus TaxID=2640874 RepID=UPI003F936AD0
MSTHLRNITLLSTFGAAISERLAKSIVPLHDLPDHELARRLVESIGHSDAVDVGLFAMLLHSRGMDRKALATHAVAPLLNVIRSEIAQLERAELEERIAQPYGYWLDGEWYGYQPDEKEPLRPGETRTLTPVWTHNEAVTFVGVPVDGRDDVEPMPATTEDAALLRPYLKAGDAQ